MNLRLFLTSQKYIGLGSESLQMGDVVWIVQGSRVPLILREVQTNVYRLVGGAYIHGFMHGEALQLNADFINITIV